MNIERSPTSHDVSRYVCSYEENHLNEYFDYVASNPDFIIRSIIINKMSGVNARQLNLLEHWDENYKIVQFWDTEILPPDVHDLVSGWRDISPAGCHLIFNERSAREFIASNYPNEFTQAYDYCYHPAMKSDYFRMAYLLKNGGLYVDADERAASRLPPVDFSIGDFLALSPLMREREQDQQGRYKWFTMDEFLDLTPAAHGPVCYFNNNVIFCNKGNTIIQTALLRATRNIFSMMSAGVRRNVHIVTGPTCLTFSIAVNVMHSACAGTNPSDVCIIDRRNALIGNVSSTVSCNYKQDHRNWNSIQ